MPQTLIALHIADLSQFTKQLRASLVARRSSEPVSHLTLMNLIAKSAGYRNVQALRAQAVPSGTSSPAVSVAPPGVDPNSSYKEQQLIERTLRVFDHEARMQRWPTGRSTQRLCTWFMWSRFERGCVYTERQVNEVLKQFDGYGGYVVMRRELINDGLFVREPDGSKYQRVETKPPASALAVIRALSERVKA